MLVGVPVVELGFVGGVDIAPERKDGLPEKCTPITRLIRSRTFVRHSRFPKLEVGPIVLYGPEIFPLVLAPGSWPFSASSTALARRAARRALLIAQILTHTPPHVMPFS
jgi:hypothetical protein